MASIVGSRHAVRVVASVANDTPTTPPSDRPHGVEMLEIPRPPQRAMRRPRLVLAALGGKPAWAVEWTSERFQRALGATITDWRPDVMHVEFVVLPFAITLPPRPASRERTLTPTLAFVGSRHHPPNAEALRHLVDDLMPRIWRTRPDVELLAIGSDPPEFLRDADPRVKAAGFVPDLADALSQVSLVLAPVTTGRGMRVKVLEAIALGTPIVAAPRAVRGLPLDAIDAVAVADGDEAFAATVLDLLADDARREQLARDARMWAERWLAPEAVADRYDDLYELVDALTEAGFR
jgi:glycosyltransferase involved in cell wall biosynthesis